MAPRTGWRRYADVVHPEDPQRAESLARTLVDVDFAHWMRVKDTSHTRPEAGPTPAALRGRGCGPSTSATARTTT